VKDLQNNTTFHWISSHCGVVGNEKPYYLEKEGTKISQTSACKLIFHSAMLSIKSSIQVDLSEYYAIRSQRKSWYKRVKNRNVIPDFPTGTAVATFRLIIDHVCLVAHLHRLSIYPSPVCVLCREDNFIMNQYHLPEC
jgi:hypothetical protein